MGKAIALFLALGLCSVAWLMTHPSDAKPPSHITQQEASARCEAQGHGPALSEESRVEGSTEDTQDVYQVYPCFKGGEVAAYQS